MQFNPLIPELTVSNIENTKKFYIEILQFKLEYERPEKKFIFLSKEGNQLMFDENSKNKNSDNWETAPLEYPYGRGINFEMTVSNVKELYNRVLSYNIKPFRELMTNRYRKDDEYIVQNEFLIQDPDGYLLRFTD